MGSGTLNRKKTDETFIRVPKTTLGISGLSGMSKSNAVEVCIPSFDVKLKQGPLIKGGVKVNLSKQNDIYVITVGDTQVGVINPKYSKMISQCAALNVTYKGEIVGLKNIFYARFVRFSR